MTTKEKSTNLEAIEAEIRKHQPDMLEDLRTIVELESPSFSKSAVEALGQEVATLFERVGGRTHFHKQTKFGDHLQVDFKRNGREKSVLVLGHLDTVWDLGTLANMPFRLQSGIASGPGILDMKSGIVMAMYAIQALRESGASMPNVTCLWVTDEEVGSESSRAITEGLARESSAVLVLEPAQMPGAKVKTSRKAVGEFKVKVSGRAAHSGIDFDKGQNAVLELAKQIVAMSNLVDEKRGITLNPGVVRGGTRSNVVAAQAECDVDVRVANGADAQFIEAKLRQLRPFDTTCRVEVTGRINRPAMERTAGVAKLYQMAREVARELGFDLGEAATGGGSDGNFTAALGVPTLDGLGGVGGGAHAPDEHIQVAELDRRTALLAGLIQRCGVDY